MTGTVGGCTVFTTQLSVNEATGMVPLLVLVTPLVHRASSSSVTFAVGLAVIVSENVRVCRDVSVVPIGTTDGRLEPVMLSVMVSLLTTVHVTAQPPPPVLQATEPVMSLWWALAAPAIPTTAKPTARTSVTILDTPRWIGRRRSP